MGKQSAEDFWGTRKTMHASVMWSGDIHGAQVQPHKVYNKGEL